jgi:aldehyde dehydrogenase (NAD+)/aldehyde dehydrogenase (NAD(P)+)
VGRIVATAAAKTTTPTTLELGGKCPVIVDPRGANLAVVAKRILWGRTNNAGQTCVAPDYVLIPRSSQDAFVTELKKSYKEFFADSASTSDSYARLVNQSAASRIKGYLDGTKGDIVIGGNVDTQTCYIEPTIVSNVDGDDSTMQDEIFGPVMSIVPVYTLGDAITFIAER